MAQFACCFWWFVFGLLLGWLLNWLFSRWFRRDPPVETRATGFKSNPPAADPPAATGYTAPIVAAAPIAAAATATVRPGVDMEAARAAGFHLRHADDLQIIEGIGPKIDALFRDAGVTTFAQVAKAKVSDLQAILDKGGSHFHLAKPGTWPQQAELAYENRWSDLKRLQDELIGGVEPPHNV